MSKKIKYDDAYVNFGFDFVVVDGVEKSKCISAQKCWEMDQTSFHIT